MNPEYKKHFSEESFWKTLQKLPGRVGRKALEEALILYLLLVEADTPLWARLAIVAVLGYLVCPLDSVPDFIPLIGYADDLALVAMLLAKMDGLVTDEVRERARRRLPGSVAREDR